MSQTIKQRLKTKLRYCLQHRQIPESCQQLVFKLWPTALFNILKQHDEQSAQWQSAIRLYRELIDSIQPIESRLQYEQTKSEHLSLVRNCNNILLLYHHENRIEPAIKSLLAHYNQSLQHARVQLESVADPDALNKIARLPSMVKPGIWCELYIDENTPPRRLRLAIINSQTAQLIFVNRHGIKILQKDADDFTRELLESRSRIYKHDSLFSRNSDKTPFQKIG
ncbi:MAG TPA: DUF1631 family protein [Gammaproteobacteria bacterium]